MELLSLPIVRLFRSPCSVIAYPLVVLFTAFASSILKLRLFVCFFATSTFYQLALVNMASTLLLLYCSITSISFFMPAFCASSSLFILRYTTSCHSFLSFRCPLVSRFVRFTLSDRYQPPPPSEMGTLFLFLLFPIHSPRVRLGGDGRFSHMLLRYIQYDVDRQDTPRKDSSYCSYFPPLIPRLPPSRVVNSFFNSFFYVLYYNYISSYGF